MAFKSLQEFIHLLEHKNELIRITGFIDTQFEITEIADRISKEERGGKALLFENNGTGFPVLINAFGSERRMCLALGHETLDDVGAEIALLFKKLTAPSNSLMDKLKMLPLLSQVASWMPKRKSGKAACQEVVMDFPDLDKLPVLTCWPADGGPIITLPCVVTRDPETGIRNVGMYRMQVFSKDCTGMHWHKHKTGARHYEGYKRLGHKMPVSVVLGGDPAYTYAATAPLPDNIDEYMLAGFLRKKKVELVKCLTNDLEVPADADFIIEGYVDPAEELAWEGPFGDHTGFYSLADWYPRFHVTCITHRKNAVYPATIVGIPPQEDAYIGLATEKIFLTPMKLTMIPELKDMFLPPAGVAHNLTLAKIHKSFAGQAAKVMNAMWGAGQMMFNKILIVTDDKNNIRDIRALAKLVSERVEPNRDILFSQGPMDVLDHSSDFFAYGSKMGIDASEKFEVERSPNDKIYRLPDSCQFKDLKVQISTLKAVNSSLPDQGISMLILAVKKEKKDYLKEIASQLLAIESCRMIKFFVFVDAELDIQSLEDVAWFVTGNLDPRRDCLVIEPHADGEPSHLFIDGTRKRPSQGFKREWPNPVVSDAETIASIDAKWDELGLGPLIVSPSIRYLSLRVGYDAVSDF